MSQRLAERLKTETRALHLAAERSRFMGELLRGRVTLPAYCALLRNLHVIYATLEPALDRHARHPGIAPICLPALWRTSAIEHDLGVLHGPGWAEALALQPAAVEYAERLREIERKEVGLLSAHAYVRYLGDLSGGQLLRGIVAGMGWQKGSAVTSFYEFGDAARTRDLTQRFRAGLVALPADAAREQALVDEACVAFRAHSRLFDELA